MKLRLDDYENIDAEFFQLGRICRRKALSLRELETSVYSTGGQAENSQVFKVDFARNRSEPISNARQNQIDTISDKIDESYNNMTHRIIYIYVETMFIRDGMNEESQGEESGALRVND